MTHKATQTVSGIGAPQGFEDQLVAKFKQASPQSSTSIVKAFKEAQRLLLLAEEAGIDLKHRFYELSRKYLKPALRVLLNSTNNMFSLLKRADTQDVRKVLSQPIKPYDDELATIKEVFEQIQSYQPVHCFLNFLFKIFSYLFYTRPVQKLIKKTETAVYNMLGWKKICERELALEQKEEEEKRTEEAVMARQAAADARRQARVLQAPLIEKEPRLKPRAEETAASDDLATKSVDFLIAKCDYERDYIDYIYGAILKRIAGGQKLEDALRAKVEILVKRFPSSFGEDPLIQQAIK